MRDGEMISLKDQPSIVDDEFSLIGDTQEIDGNKENQEELIPC
jgi:hypothetical protein